MTTTQATSLIIHHSPWTSHSNNNNNSSATSQQHQQQQTTKDSADIFTADTFEETVIVVEANGDKVILPQETAIAMPEGQNHHSRCNSVVPPNLEATEGGRERAALATVFGVQEYTESNTFWERLVQQHQEMAAKKQQEELLKKKKNNALQVNADNNRQQQHNTLLLSPPPPPPKKQYAITRKPVPGASSPPPPLPPLKINNSTTTSSSASSSGATAAAFKPLPDIPNVSKFNDFLIEDEHGMDLMFPASPSSVMLHSFSPHLDHTMIESSVHSSIVLLDDVVIDENQQEEQEHQVHVGGGNHVVYPPKLFIGYPPAIFDMLKSDDDERIIVWGPDPTFDESSMVSSPTALNDQESIISSGSTIATNNNNNKKPSTPSIQGFSTNATAHNSNNNGNSSGGSNSNNNNNNGASNTSNSNLTHGSSTGKRRSNLVNSARMSAQSLFADGINRLSRQKSLPTKIRPRLRLDDAHASYSSTNSNNNSNNTNSGRSTPRLLKRASFTMKHRISDEELRSTLPPAPSVVAPRRAIEAASVEKLVEKLTNSLDYTLMTDFFLTYRTFISPTQLCKLLILRFRWALESDQDDRRVVRIRTFVVMRHWLLNYFIHDFIPCRELRIILTTFLNSLPQYTLVKQSPRDQRIVRGLKKVVRNLKTVHYGPSQQHQAHNNNNIKSPTDLDIMDKSTWVESSASQANPLLDGLRNSVLGDDNASLDSDLSPGNSLATPENLDEQQEQDIQYSITNESTSDWSSEDQVMSKLQYERRRREEEEERLRAEFFTTSSVLTTESSDLPSLVNQATSQDGFLSSTSDFMLSSPTVSSIGEKKQANNSKRPQLPAEYIAAMTHAAMLKAQPQENNATKVKKYIPATIMHDMNTPDIDRHIRRIPSSKWCKASPEENPAYNKNSQNSKEANQQQQQNQTPSIGLARKLSRKSIERRKSEKNLRDVSSQASSSVSSSVASTPRLQSADSSYNNTNNTINSNGDHSIVPELPPLPPATDLEAASAAATALSFKLNQQQQLQQQATQTTTPNKRIVMMMAAGKQSFEALPYDTMAAPSPEPSGKQNQGHKRRLSKKLSKIFKQQQATDQAATATSTTDQPPVPLTARNILKKKASFTSSFHQKINTTPVITTPPATATGPEPFILSQEECSSKLEVSMDDTLVIRAPALDTTSHSSDSNVEVSTPTTPNNSTSNQMQSPSTTVGRIAAELRDDDDDDIPNVELRRSSSTIENHTTDGFFKRPAHGPIYLSHLVGSQPFGFESDAAVNIQELDDGDSSDSSDDDDNNGAQVVVGKLNMNNNKKRGSNAGLNRGLSLSSYIPKHIRTMSLIVEPDRLGEFSAAATKEEENQEHAVSSPTSPVSATSAAVTATPTITTVAEAPLALPKPVSPIMERQKSFILLYPANKLAQQLCLIERQVLFGVEWEELVDCRWRNGITGSGGVQRLIQRFNAACQWVVSEIVTTETLQERVEVIRRFIRLAQQCKTYANFATLLQILLGLQSPAVSRLHSTWAQVGATDMRLLDQLSAFTSPMKNWKNIRDSMTKVAEEFGDHSNHHPTTGQQGFPPPPPPPQNHDITTDAGGCIPFLGIYLSDLVFNSELPPYIEPVKTNKTTCDSLMLQQPLVNFRKHRITATVIKRVLTFQNLARRYPFTPEPELFRLCLDLKSVVDTEKIRKLSHDIEP